MAFDVAQRERSNIKCYASVFRNIQIKCIKSGLYGGDRAGKYFIFISILKLIKTILKLQEKYRKND